VGTVTNPFMVTAAFTISAKFETIFIKVLKFAGAARRSGELLTFCASHNILFGIAQFG
jgi:hypothetical protein